MSRDTDQECAIMTYRLPSSLTVISSRCRDIFPHNSRSEFSNVLSSPLLREDNDGRIYIQASSIAISTKINNPPQVIKVNIRDLLCQVEDEESSRCIAILNFPPKEILPGYALHTFENAIFLPLHNPHTYQIRVTLTDEKDQPLQIRKGGETILTLAVTDDEMKARRAFTITCSSYHPTMYPGNNMSNFVHPLLNDLHLGDRYEVALQSIVFPPHLYERSVATMRLEGEVFRYRLSELGNTHAFLNAVQMDVIESKLGVELHFEVVNGSATMTRGEIAMDDTPEVLDLEFNREFFLACGDTRGSHEKVRLRRGDTMVFHGQPDINLAIPNPVSILESNVVESSMVADGKMNVLHCVPVMTERRVDHKNLYIPHKLFFRPVTRSPLECIRFRFANPDGEGREFKTRGTTHSNILITLAFRRRL